MVALHVLSRIFTCWLVLLDWDGISIHDHEWVVLIKYLLLCDVVINVRTIYTILTGFGCLKFFNTFSCSSKSNIPVWPFLILSFFGGAYALLPYFVLWNPPPPPVEREELMRWPLNFLESKLTAGVSNSFFFTLFFFYIYWYIIWNWWKQ